MHAIVVAIALAFSALGTPAAPTRWVTDEAGFLSPATRTALDGRLEAYEQSTGHQIIVWIAPSLDGADLADWSVRTFNAWQLGRKGVDDGIAMFVFAEDRKIDIEVGYGLEDKVPDAIASRIIREVMTPRLQANDRDAAVTSGVDAILAAIEGKPWDGSVAAPVKPEPPSTVSLIVGGVLLVALLWFVIRNPRSALFLLWALMGRGGGGFGGFGGGGGGGFGGGGGRSGGGGARGGW
jgi:uncharacterized protein